MANSEDSDETVRGTPLLSYYVVLYYTQYIFMYTRYIFQLTWYFVYDMQCLFRYMWCYLIICMAKVLRYSRITSILCANNVICDTYNSICSINDIICSQCFETCGGILIICSTFTFIRWMLVNKVWYTLLILHYKQMQESLQRGPV